MPAVKPVTKTTSQKQIESNRRNALKSSGPATAKGRAVSSQNARKYELLPFENAKLPAQITAQYYRQYVPADKYERRLVDIMAFADRVRRNCLELEGRIYSQELADYRRGAAECAHRNALRQLNAVRAEAA